jgi:small multidrug resistance pump
VSELKDEHKVSPKSDASNATIGVNECVYRRIQQLKLLTVEVRAGRATRRYKGVKSDGPEDLVFQSVTTGAPMRDNNILTRHIKPAGRKIGLEFVNFGHGEICNFDFASRGELAELWVAFRLVRCKNAAPNKYNSGTERSRSRGLQRRFVRKAGFMCWLWLFLAIALEVAATVCLKLSNGFSKFVPTALMALFYGSSFFPMTIALRKMEVGTAYAAWSAVGTALITIIGVLVFKEAASPLKLSAIVMIVVGVVYLNVANRERFPQAGGQDSSRTMQVQSVVHTGTLAASTRPELEKQANRRSIR